MTKYERVASPSLSNYVTITSFYQYNLIAGTFKFRKCQRAIKRQFVHASNYSNEWMNELDKTSFFSLKTFEERSIID